MKKKCMECGEEFEAPHAVYTHCPKCRIEFDEQMKELFERAKRRV